MNLFLTILLAVAMVMAAPTSTYSAAKPFKAEVLNAVIEDLCLDMSHTLCMDADDHKFQYGVYDPTNANGICKCSDKPSAYIVRAVPHTCDPVY